MKRFVEQKEHDLLNAIKKKGELVRLSQSLFRAIEECEALAERQD